jgi:cell division transport system permease protein
MRALRYFFGEAASSIWRRRGRALVAVTTIASGLFVLGCFLLATENLRRLAERWRHASELSVYLADGITSEQLKTVERQVAGSGLAAGYRYLSKQEALDRFRADFPDLAPAASSMSTNPLPASFEVRLRPEIADAAAAESLSATLVRTPGVVDVRFDREWLERLQTVIRGLNVAGIALVAILSVAAAMTVANIVRLAAAARRDEIEIMQLVGAPLVFIRGPFVAEGILQGGLGAALGVAALAAAFYGFRAGAFGVAFLRPPVLALLVAAGMAVGCVGGYIAARQVR